MSQVAVVLGCSSQTLLPEFLISKTLENTAETNNDWRELIELDSDYSGDRMLSILFGRNQKWQGLHPEPFSGGIELNTCSMSKIIAH